MIKLIEKIIKDKIDSRFNSSHFDFVKYSTPLSGDGSDGKVLFFVFANNSKEPLFIVKTVRQYKESFIIKNGYNNLKNLNELIKDTEYSNMFPKVLFIYDDTEEFIFSVESFCVGRKAINTDSDINMIIEKYTDFQKSIYTKEVAILLVEYGEKLIKQLDLHKNDENTLIGYFEEIADDKSLKLGQIQQHGDLTLDNMFIHKGKLKIIDCDLFGELTLAGYDLYRFLVRYNKSSLVVNLDNHFNKVGIDMKISKSLLFVYYLNELLFKKDYILKNKTGEDVINDFKKMHLC
jgi:hypothetical protein